MASSTPNGGGKGTPRRGRVELIAPSASPTEAAAIVAALERFMRATAPVAQPPAKGPAGWQRMAMLEAVAREDDSGPRHPWVNT